MRDEYASVVQPMKQLKHFERFHLKKGEEKKVTFVLTEEDFFLVNYTLKIVESRGLFR